jgi:hypothetical protein
MKKVSTIAVVIVAIVILLLIGYRIINNDKRLAENYVESKGYKIVKTLGEPKKEILSKKLLLGRGHQQIWMVQDKSPDKYLGKEIIHYGFIVKNHPRAASDGAFVWVMVSDNIVIGGYSQPYSISNPPVGGFYSIEGNSREAYSGKTFTEWVNEWVKKYGNN